MKKLFKYRPISPFLFKELHYQELYFASYSELNDPLDLSARIDFTSNDKEAIEYLVWFIVKSQIDFNPDNNSKLANSKIIRFNRNDEEVNKLRDKIFFNVEKVKNQKKNIWLDDILVVIENSIQESEIDIIFNTEKFIIEVQRLTNKFLKNSFVNCFSETNDNFLMWSHYASKHSGICMEFELLNSGFPYEKVSKRELDNEKYLKRISKWNLESAVFWDRLNKVSYQEEQPYINFYNFAVVFENEHDCDLIGLSKSWTHKYAYELENVFSTKTKNWSYENEWRAIEINFQENKIPEKRIRHYPIECLTGIYFGQNTPKDVKNRIYDILIDKNENIEFWEGKINGNNQINFRLFQAEE